MISPLEYCLVKTSPYFTFNHMDVYVPTEMGLESPTVARRYTQFKKRINTHV